MLGWIHDGTPTRCDYAGIKGYYLLLVLGGISIAFFLYQVQKATRLVLLGAPDKRFDSWGKRLKETLTVWLWSTKGSGGQGLQEPCTF